MSIVSQFANSPEGKQIAAEVDRRIKAAVKSIQIQLDAATAEIGNLRQEIEALKRQR